MCACVCVRERVCACVCVCKCVCICAQRARTRLSSCPDSPTRIDDCIFQGPGEGGEGSPTRVDDAEFCPDSPVLNPVLASTTVYSKGLGREEKVRLPASTTHRGRPAVGQLGRQHDDTPDYAPGTQGS